MSDPLAALREVDSQRQLDDVLALPDHLRDALWRAESAGISRVDGASGVVVCGMGGSAIGGDLALAALAGRLSLPLETVRGYELPPWTAPDRLVLCSSYSGNTEETLACYSAAGVLAAPRIVATTGGALADAARRDGVPVIGLPAGLQPRAAVGYMLVAATEAVLHAGAAEPIHGELEAAAGRLEASRDALIARAADLADELSGLMPVLYGADLTAPVAYRWKCQINENSKLPAWCHTLPEMDHNEIVGWRGAGNGTPSAAIFLVDVDQHPRVRRRIALTAELVEPHAGRVLQIETEGETRTERLLWFVVLGDLVSLFLAARQGIDPSPVDVIEELKERLGRP